MKVKQLAERNDVNLDTIRYYTRIGLLNPTKNPLNGYKEYSASDEQRLQFILRAKSLGFSLTDIETFVEESLSGHAPCPKVREIMTTRIAQIEEKIVTMQSTCEQMKKALTVWQALPDCTPTGDHVCHLIEGFSEQGASNV